jgi:uncharacterized damage-inducible protein DinB
MFAGNQLELMAEYNRWMNGKLYAACAGLEDIELKAERGAFFGSIFGTLNHLLWGDRVWLSRFNGVSYPVGAINEWLYQDFAALQQARTEMDEAILAWTKSLTAEQLNAPYTWSSKLYGFTQTHPLWAVAMQMFNHQTHHRGQITTLLSQIGIDIGETDLPLTPVLMEQH